MHVNYLTECLSLFEVKEITAGCGDKLVELLKRSFSQACNIRATEGAFNYPQMEMSISPMPAVSLSLTK